MRKFIGGRRVFVDLRGASLDDGLLLWEEYMGEARERIAGLGERGIEIKYEDFLENPNDVLNTLYDFCGLETHKGDVEGVAGKVNKSRGYVYLNDPELLSYSEVIADRLRNYGY